MSGGSEKERGSLREVVLLGGVGLDSLSGEVIALAERFLTPGLFGLAGPLEEDRPDVIGSNTGGCGESVWSPFCLEGRPPLEFLRGGVEGWVGVPGLLGAELSFLLLRKFFLPNNTEVRLLTPLWPGCEELLSFEDVLEDSVVLELSEDLLFSISLAPTSGDSLSESLRDFLGRPTLPRPLPLPLPLLGVSLAPLEVDFSDLLDFGVEMSGPSSCAESSLTSEAVSAVSSISLACWPF